MYLKQIELQGFKSFPDRTRLIFEPGATVIIGPNGSGKSNISDAMRWVLGEISSKSLRGTKMEDIIFGGSDSRKPMSYAEVSVTFDNTSVGSDARLDCPYDEVTVTRRYYRNGDSEYFINKGKVRLRDIYELFLNTGIGRDGYSIIGQGRIADIISRKNDERRGIFEDAAGIAKFRHRKNEAERKLAATEQNMERVQDIVSVLGSRIATLERESVKAKRFIEYSEVKRQADVQLWLYDTEGLRVSENESNVELRRTDREIEETDESLATLREQQERLESLAFENKAEAARIASEISARTRDNYELDAKIKVINTNITHTESSVSVERATAEGLRTSASDEDARAEAKDGEAKAIAANIAELTGEESKLSNQAADAEKLADKHDSQIGLAFEELSAAKEEISDIHARLELLGRSDEEDEGRDEAARKNVNERKKLAAAHEAECEDSERTIAEYDAKLAENAELLAEKKAEAETLRTKRDSDRSDLTSAEIRIDTLGGKIEALRRMEEHFEGYNNSVKFVMRSYSEGKIDGGKIYGPLSSLITVDSKYVTAIETALGAAIQNIVVDEERTARAAINCLKRNNAGRATFFPLTSVRAASEPTREMKQAASFNGYIGIASELVSADAKFNAVLSSMLGRIIVFDTLENATEMAKALRYSVRTVTLDGQQINRDGSFTGGSLRTSSGILTRADEIKRMSAELEVLSKNSTKLRASLETLEATLSELENDIEADESANSMIATLRAVEATRLEKNKETLAADRELLEKFMADLENVAGEKERRAAEIEMLEARERELTVKVSELEEFRAETEEKRHAALKERDKLRADIMNVTVRISELRRDIESCNALAEMSREKARSLRIDAVARENAASEAKARVAELKGELDKAIKTLGTGEEKLTELNARRTAIEEGSLEYEGKLVTLRNSVEERRSRRDKLIADKLRLETNLAQIRAKLDAETKAFWDEYGLTRAEAMAFGYPTITAEERPAVFALQTEYRNKIRNIGHVNLSVIDEYQTEKAQYDEKTAQMADLEKAKNELEKVIKSLEAEMEKTFVDSFNQINENFKRTFSELFGGGSAELILTEPDNVLESGIEIKAAPPGKIIKSLMQLSGGEQAFVAIALFFAILQVNPTPFCILDEIEAALDEVNVERFSQYIHRYSDDTQFILITHRRGTMNAADRLYGVTMPESGISKILTLDVAEIANKKGELFDGIS
ncbi:MAG: chromosome segregation protein SMC [Clostridia bacterium]|nr:chromosome segregation protein SMC [Clostridia bacterium]